MKKTKKKISHEFVPGDNFFFSTYKKEIICFRSNPEPLTLFCRDFYFYGYYNHIPKLYT